MSMNEYFGTRKLTYTQYSPQNGQYSLTQKYDSAYPLYGSDLVILSEF